ncbi:MAG: hypothetical protein ACMXYB_02120 [Candidatus Woesearchaeota archaeon]
METLESLSKKVEKLERKVENSKPYYNSKIVDSKGFSRLEESSDKLVSQIDYKLEMIEKQLLELRQVIDEERDLDSREILLNEESMKKFNSSKEDIEKNNVEKISKFDKLLK